MNNQNPNDLHPASFYQDEPRPQPTAPDVPVTTGDTRGPLDILRMVQYALNELPRQALTVPDVKDTYSLVLLVERCLTEAAIAAQQPKRTSGLCLALELYHGRTDPNEDMEGHWGTEGPIFTGLNFAHVTYFSTINMELVQDGETLGVFLALKDDMVYYDGVYYGDFSLFFYDPEDRRQYWAKDRIRKYDPRLAVIPKQREYKWTQLLQAQAVAQGWGIFNVGNDEFPKFEIQRVDEPPGRTKPNFDSDGHAQRWVQAMADTSEGETIYTIAIQTIKDQENSDNG